MPSESGDHVTTGLHATHHKASPTPLMLPGPGGAGAELVHEGVGSVAEGEE